MSNNNSKKKRSAEDTATLDKVKRSKKDVPLEKVNYDDIKIKHISFRVVFVTRDMNSVAVEFCLKYKKDTVKILERETRKLYEKASNAQTLGAVIEKYQKKALGIPSIEDDSDRSESSSEGSPSDEDSDDDDDGKSMEASDDDDAIESGKADANVKIVRFSSFVNIHKLPVINPFAAFTCTLKPGTVTYPPTFEDVVIIKVTNLYVPISLHKILAKIKKVAYWLPNLAMIQRDLNTLGLKNSLFTKRDDLICMMMSIDHQNLITTLFRDVFRCPEFYWFIGLVPIFRLCYLTDEYCAKVYADVLAEKITHHLFSTDTMPLLYTDTMLLRDELVPYIDATEDDTALYMDHANLPTVLSVTVTSAAICANKLWHYWWVCIGLYQGRFIWTLDAWDIPVDMSETDRTVAIGYALAHGLIVKVSDAPKYAPVAAMSHWRDFHRHNMTLQNSSAQTVGAVRRMDFSCFTGEVDSFFDFVSSLVVAAVSDKLVVCPTLQSSHYAFSSTGMSIHNLGRADGDAESLVVKLRDVDIVVLHEMHNFSGAQFASVLGAIATAHARYKKSSRYKVVLCGINTRVLLSEHQGRSCLFDHFLSGIVRDNVICGVPTDTDVMSEDVLVSSIDTMVKFNTPAPINIQTTVIQSVTTAASTWASSSDGDTVAFPHARQFGRPQLLSQENVNSIADLIFCAFDRDSVAVDKIPLLLFENKRHMAQIVGHHKLGGVFLPTLLYVGQLVREMDGGIRRISMLWSKMVSGVYTAVTTVNLANTQPELVAYRLEADSVKTSRPLHTKPITPVYYSDIHSIRCSPIDKLDILVVFTTDSKKFMMSDLNKLLYIARRRLLILTVEKKSKMQIADTTAPTVNLFDAAAEIDMQ